ncbi:MAG: tetratricopeptide repeat protein [Candidatus Hydrogenedentes bacterium]|nr:tetratricopeptide repeat protein [Candidatus Hydrogenedentota bacterium]
MELAKARKAAAPAAPSKSAFPTVPTLPPAPFVPGIDLGLVSQDEIDAILSGRKGGGRSVATPVPQPAMSRGDALDQSEIDRLLAKAEAEPTNFAAAEAALREIDQAELDATLAAGSGAGALGDDAPLVGASGGGGPLTQAELDKLLAGGDPEQVLGGEELDAVLRAAGPAAPSDDGSRVDTAPITLGQDELDALLAAHPMAREEMPAPLPAMARVAEEDPVERAARDNEQADVGRENLAAAVPDPTAGDQPLEQDLIDSLLAQAAQAAASPTAPPGTKTHGIDAGVDLKQTESAAVALSDDDLNDLGITLPAPQVSIVSEPAPVEAAEGPEEASPVVQRRLRTGARFPAKLAASIAAALIAGSGTFGYLWSHRARPTVDTPLDHVATVDKKALEDVIVTARELMGKGEHVSAMRELGAAIRGAEEGPLLNEARFLHVEAGYRSLPPSPKAVDIETVLKNIEDVIALAPSYSRNPEALGWKAELYERTGALTTARDTYDRILTNYPTAPDTDNTLVHLARIAFQLNYFEDAERALDRVLKEFPESAHTSEAQMLLAQCYESTGRVVDAIAAYTAVAAQRTESRVGAEAALAIARISDASNDVPGAVRALETRLQTATTTDGNDAVYVALAKAYRKAGKPADAVRVARELLNFFPDSPRVPEAVVELTQALEANGESRQALELAQQAADRFDQNAEIARNRALILSKTNDARAAAAALEKADELGANDPGVLLDAGRKYQHLTESDKAAELFQRVIEKYPDSEQAVDAGVELGRHQYKKGDVAGAIDRLASLANSPNAANKQLAVQSALGDIYSDLGLTKRATAAYEQVATLATNSETLAHAATALLKNGAIGAALPAIHKVDLAKLPSKTGFDFLMAQGRAMLATDAALALEKMQQAFEQYPVERSPEDFEYLVRASLETGKTARARALVGDFDVYVQTHPEDRARLQRTAALWGDALYNAGDYRGALDAYALAAPLAAPESQDEKSQQDAQAQSQGPAPPSRDAVWAKFQSANALLKLDDFTTSAAIYDELATQDSPYAEDARIKANYARLERRLRGGPAIAGQGG